MTDTIRISSAELGREVGHCQDVALYQPVIVTRDGCDLTVMTRWRNIGGSSGATVRFSLPVRYPTS